MGRTLDPEGAHLASLRRLASLRGSRVLEMGCGDGRLTRGIAAEAASVLAFDPDEAAVREARSSLPRDLVDRVEFRVASAEAIEIPAAAFDLVVFSWSLWCIPPEGVVHALSRMIDATRPGGIVLDLQVIRPDPSVELDGRMIAQIDGAPLFAWADAAVAAIEARIAAGDLVEEAVDDHDVRKHYTDGPELVDDVAQSRRSLPEPAVPMLAAIRRQLVVRERCRTRRLRVCRRGVPPVDLDLATAPSRLVWTP